MTVAELNEMNAIDIIARSIAMHPSLFLESLQTRAYEDSRYAATRESETIKKSVLASFEAAMRACDYVRADESLPFKSDMSAGIIALNVACKLQCLPAHVKTQAAIATW
jgi:hypothetical protein